MFKDFTPRNWGRGLSLAAILVIMAFLVVVPFILPHSVSWHRDIYDKLLLLFSGFTGMALNDYWRASKGSESAGEGSGGVAADRPEFATPPSAPVFSNTDARPKV